MNLAGETAEAIQQEGYRTKSDEDGRYSDVAVDDGGGFEDHGDESEVSKTRGSRRIRFSLGVLFVVYGRPLVDWG